ncbi:MAG TPA: MlaE family lipid ABC transporter permease subunit [Planctomycetota bacterium]|nr:MlaE family lipid ABC transporter permease subunit [Planctomycetota bacterium]
MASERFRVERRDDSGDAADIAVSGSLTLPDATLLRDAVRGALARPAASYRFDLSGVEEIDSGTAAVLVDLRDEAAQGGAAAEIVGLRGNVGTLVGLFHGRGRKGAAKEAPRRIGILDQIGRATAAILGEMKGALGFVGDTLAEGVASIRRPRSLNWRDVMPIAERTGADAVPIVGLILFLLGFILAFQAAIQLHQFGADIYVADAVAISVARELGPLMVAIILAGRSGGAFAAEIGTMRVNEEVDAIRVIGLSPYRYLVFPRIAALVATMPFLVLLGDAIAIFGGFLVGVFGLSLPAEGYLIETRQALKVWDVASGLLKSVVFAGAIALIGCERGLATTGGATGVGRSTTSAVVTCLFHLVVLDFAFTLFFEAYGL